MSHEAPRYSLLSYLYNLGGNETMDLATVIELIKLIGLPMFITLIYGPPVLVLAFLLAYVWTFTGRIVENNTRSLTILEAFQSEGIKCRHD